ncbi:MAG: hypothetical protein GF346_11225 [Candidatus Eisenbacteria bacterium]|nr:hypothetical protein [Candidatus Latescibacterota bacterium]MBD3303006.1 hypothetical protein [Candidatus Eisenbacteria bacterium]
MNLFALVVGVVAGYAIKLGFDRRRMVIDQGNVHAIEESFDPHYQHLDHEHDPESQEW